VLVPVCFIITYIRREERIFYYTMISKMQAVILEGDMDIRADI